jgi:hypothetical protein
MRNSPSCPGPVLESIDVAASEDIHDQFFTVSGAHVVSHAVTLYACRVAFDVDQTVVQRMHRAFEVKEVLHHPLHVGVWSTPESSAVVVDRVVVVDGSQEFAVPSVDSAAVQLQRPINVTFCREEL